MTEHNARRMTADAQGQVEIIEVFEFQNNGEWHREDRLIALATFYWEAEQDWSDFVQQVTSVGDRMFAEFNNEVGNNVTQYIQFKTGGYLL
tara:strand:+ start:836 stop:1108 length:273 start_codon:yes stop_codon:yes gene_type:complete